MEQLPAAKSDILGGLTANLGIVTAYNDMLSAHQPFETYPNLIKQSELQYAGTAEFAGGHQQCVME